MTIEDTFLAETMTYINCYLSAVTKPPIIPGQDREFVHHGSPLHSAGGDTITVDQEHSANSKLDSSIATSLQTGKHSDSASLNLSILLESHVQLGSGAYKVRRSARFTAESVLVSLACIEDSSKSPDMLEVEAIAEDILDDLTISKADMQTEQQQLYSRSPHLCYAA
jgi:hypothetical protein